MMNKSMIVVCMCAVISTFAGNELFDAINRYDLPMVQNLLETHDPNACDHVGWPPLLSLVYRSDPRVVEIIQALLKKGARVDVCIPCIEDSPLLLACVAGLPETVKLLLRAGAAVDWPNLDGETPLMLAAHKGRPDIVDILLKWGADRRLVDEEGLDSLGRARQARERLTCPRQCELYDRVMSLLEIV